MPHVVVELRAKKVWFPSSIDVVEGEALVVRRSISFLGDVDPETGSLKELGISVAGKVLIAEGFRGSTVGSYVLYALRKRGRAPLAVVMKRLDPVVVAGCVLSSIPIAYVPDLNTGLDARFARLFRDSRLYLFVESSSRS